MVVGTNGQENSLRVLWVEEKKWKKSVGRFQKVCLKYWKVYDAGCLLLLVSGDSRRGG